MADAADYKQVQKFAAFRLVEANSPHGGGIAGPDPQYTDTWDIVWGDLNAPWPMPE